MTLHDNIITHTVHSGGDGDGLGARGEAEAVIQLRATRTEHIARRPLAPRFVAERDVRRRGEAGGARRVEARRAAGVHGARARAEVCGARGTVGDRRDERGDPEGGDVADEGEVGVGGGEEVLHLGDREEGERGLEAVKARKFKPCTE